MQDYVMLSIASIFLAVAILAVWLTIRTKSQTMDLLQNQHQQSQNELLEVLRAQSRLTMDLLNRIQAQDLPTYQTMTWQHNYGQNGESVSDPYINRSDEAEAAILAGNAVGLGMPVYDEDTELQQTLDEMMGRRE